VLQWLALLGLVATAAVSVEAVELTLTARALSQAIDVGQSRIAAVRTRFHQPYRIQVSQLPVDYIDIVTPFRRVALAAEAHSREGKGLFGQREALAALGSSRNQVDVFVELTFHPFNTYVGVPGYEVRLLGDPPDAPVAPRDTERIPRVGPRVQGLPSLLAGGGSLPEGRGEPLAGGTIVAHFSGEVLELTAAYDIVVIDAGHEIARVRVDLGNLR